uniref:Protein kinase domain-containing protein n=1 Tax=Odontella aurita TaxID=265563 RepID=A0A7S4K387_9STRA|mmetsp:Transcript_60581/g.179583  ORF Transcript_60581/g.179583 Transcript_60581/m.179583 type:complete len:1135 (+) Transcript_60581:496-3900(+)|eukprot:CAMPEP_0113534210 /NCGR_PEP_ID=MMETSP0015_2-20120614/5040_1 /TAXON_ID=2838 /ORGANISM="Odontella" /LENGTH=1134 /DNA_ID=CAMNT_0000433361 /DNA_START=405 /DNA_END=3809 /DNA_ORIENTATION=- /assembly_acc=CAM_ASM_000160
MTRGGIGRRHQLRRRLQVNTQFLRHHTAGLGDGKFHKGHQGGPGVDRGPPPGLPVQVGKKNDNNRYVRTREGRSQSQPHKLSPFDPPDVLDRAAAAAVDEGVVPYVAQREQRQWDRSTTMAGVPHSDRVGAVTATDDDAPWQISVLALLGIIAILVALFLHLISDPDSSSKARPHYHPRRTRRQARPTISFQSKKKKTDELSEDDFMSDVDGSYQADSETRAAMGSSSAGVATRATVPPAPLYYPMDYNPPQQQHRQRKQVGQAVAAGSSSAAQSPVPNRTVIDSHPYYHRTVSGGGGTGVRIFAGASTQPQEYSPSGAITKTSTRPKAQLHQVSATVASPPPRRLDETTAMADHQSESLGLGTGLEGFVPVAKPSSFAGKVVTLDETTTLSSPRRSPQQYRLSGRADIGSPIKVAQKLGIDLTGDRDEPLDDAPILGRIGTSSPFESFNSLPLDDESQGVPDQSSSHDSMADVELRSSPKGATPTSSAQDSFGMDSSPSGLRYRWGGEQDRLRQSVAVLSGSCDHDFTPRVDNVKRIISFTKPGGKMHDSDVESASGEVLPPPPLYSSADEDNSAGLRDVSPHAFLDRSSSAQAAELSAAQEQHVSQQNPSSEGGPSETARGGNGKPLLFNGVRLPLIPDLEFEERRATDLSTPAAPHSPSVHELARPPRSVTLEELHLIKMESGGFKDGSSKWGVASTSAKASEPKADAGQSSFVNLPRPHESVTKSSKESTKERKETGKKTVKLNVSPSHESGKRGQQSSMQGLASPNRNESQWQLMKEISQKSPARASAQGFAEPATPIDHKRPDVTKWSDSAASLTLPIDFSELNLTGVIGGGGFGQVWKAMWRGTPVAVKILSSSAQTENVTKSVLEEFASEINMVSGMRHPNICLYMGACLDPPNRAIVTEFAAHGSLWDALRSPLDPPFTAADGISRNAWPLGLYESGSENTRSQGWYDATSATNLSLAPAGAWPWVLVKRVASGACRGMTYLHSGRPPVLHRDLKSANLLLDDSYTTKVADFGLSRIKAQERSMTGNCGTVQWMAPEILANQGYAEPADVYSFGIILWELLSRECPFEGMSPIQCALAVLNKHAKPEIPTWCPPSFAALIEACVDRNPSARPTFSQILSALDTMP